MRSEISRFVELNGLQMRVWSFLEAWASHWTSNQTEIVPFKHGASQWNDGPTSFHPFGCVACKIYNRETDKYEPVSVYEIWYRKDGFGERVFFFPTYQDYLDYTPDDRTPDAINREIGLCANYHKGI